MHKAFALWKDRVGFRIPPASDIAHSYDGFSDCGQVRLALYAMMYVDTTGTVSVSYRGVIVMTIVTVFDVGGR